MNALGMISTVVMARLLVPADFGVVAIGMTVLAIVQAVTNMSLGQALIHLDEPDDRHLDCAWTLNMLRGLLLGGIIAALGPFLADLYGDERLKLVLAIFGGSVFISGLANTKLAMLERDLLFHQRFIMQTSSKLVLVIISIAVAWQTRSYVALVAGTVASQVTQVLVSYAVAPRIPRLRLKEAGALLSFSWWLTLTEIMATINVRFEPLVIGKFLTIHTLGLFTVATNLSSLPTRETTRPLSATLFPAFRQLRDQPERLRRAYTRAQTLISAIALPCGILMAVLAKPLVLLVLGEKWSEVVPILQVLAIVAASMTLDMGNADKLNSFAQEARRLSIQLEQPSVNHSEVGFVPHGNTIRYSLAALKNVGRPAVESIVAERAANGPFADISDFARRLNPRHVNKRALETLATAGAFDDLGIDRATALENVDRMILAGNSALEAKAGGQNDLFLSGGNAAPPPIELRPASPWLPTDRLSKEFEAVGFFLTGHPLDDYRDVLDSLGAETWTAFSAKAQMRHVVGKLAGTVLSARERKGKSGNPYAFVAFSDATGQFEAVIFSEALIAARALLEPGSVVLLDVEAEAEGETVRVRIQGISSLDNTAEERSSGMKVTVDDPQAISALAERIGGGGQGTFRIVLRVDGKEVEFDLPQGIDSTPRQRSALKLVEGVREVSVL